MQNTSMPITRHPSLHWNAFSDPLHAPIKKGKEKAEIIGDNFPEGQMCPICLVQSSLVEPLTSEKCRSLEWLSTP